MKIAKTEPVRTDLCDQARYHHCVCSGGIGVGIVSLVNCLLDLDSYLSKCLGMLVIDSLVVIIVNVKPA